MEIRLAENGDLSGWVRLVEPMRHLFPGLETPESMEGYARDIAGAISRQEALCAVENGTIPEAQIDQSVARVLAWKYDLGLLGY